MKNLLYIIALILSISACSNTEQEENKDFIDIGDGVSYRFIKRNDTGDMLMYGATVNIISKLEDDKGTVLMNSQDSEYANYTIPLDTNYLAGLGDAFWNVLLSMHHNDEVVFKGKTKDIFAQDKKYMFNLKADDIIYLTLKTRLIGPRNSDGWTVYPPEVDPESEITDDIIKIEGQ